MQVVRVAVDVPKIWVVGAGLLALGLGLSRRIRGTGGLVRVGSLSLLHGVFAHHRGDRLMFYLVGWGALCFKLEPEPLTSGLGL